MKIKVKIKDEHLLVKTKFNEDDFCQREFNVFESKYIHGFLKPSLEKKNKILFSGPVSKSLYDRLKDPISKYDLLFIVELIIEIFRKANKIGVPTNKILLDLKYVFYNESTKSVWVMYIPLKNVANECNIREFLLIVLQRARLINGNDANAISELAFVIAKSDVFDSDLVERCIYKLDRNVVNSVRKHNTTGSGFITNKRKDYYEHYENSVNNNDDTIGNHTENYNTVEPNVVSNTSIPEDDDSTGLLTEDYNPYATNVAFNQVAPNVASSINIPDDDETGLLTEDYNPAASNATINQVAPNVSSNINIPEDDDGTGLLTEDYNPYGTNAAFNQVAPNVVSDISIPEDDDSTGLLTEEYNPYATNAAFNQVAPNVSSRINIVDDDGTGILTEDYNPVPPNATLNQVAQNEPSNTVAPNMVSNIGAQAEDYDSTGLLTEDYSPVPPNATVNQVAQNEPSNTVAPNMVSNIGAQAEDYDSTGLLTEDYSPVPPNATLNQVAQNEASNTVAPNMVSNIGAQAEDYDSTGLLAEDYNPVTQNAISNQVESNVASNTVAPEDEGTGLLVETDNRVHFPRLIRCHTNEEILINKPVFRIGKERSYVDYFVFDNNAVSRSHADIISRGEHIFVVDLNSKNRTFINNRVLPVKYETEIFDGDILKLANEEFIFHK